jgi:ABC-type phosphate/phosphonate transport system ATPase subunit
VDGDEINMSASKLTQWRPGVGFIFQMYNLIPVLTRLPERGTAAAADKLSKRSANSMWKRRYPSSDWSIG